jgi:hypothetical protein
VRVGKSFVFRRDLLVELDEGIARRVDVLLRDERAADADAARVERRRQIADVRYSRESLAAKRAVPSLVPFRQRRTFRRA